MARHKLTTLNKFPVTTQQPVSRALVAKNVILDGRLALFHRRERWLAVADLHFGYELSQRAAGNLFPLWGMQPIETRLHELLRDYDPLRLILLGDLLHDATAADELALLIRRLSRKSRVVLIAGNHDRRLSGRIAPAEAELVESWQNNGFYFHHGHGPGPRNDGIEVIGHHHPAGIIRDGAGLRLKLPAFVQQQNRWIMPAFSPWAAGVEWQSEEDRLWLCSPQRVLPFSAGWEADAAFRSRAPAAWCNADNASP
jgi:uncharacterized protein